MEAAPYQEKLWSQFCALYLPRLVDKIVLDFPRPTGYGLSPEEKEDLQLDNAYTGTLFAIQKSPYFTKYMRSRESSAENRSNLPQFLAERLISLSPRWDYGMKHVPTESRHPSSYYKAAAARIVELLATMNILLLREESSGRVLSEAVRSRLQPILKKWSSRVPEPPLGINSQRLLWALEGDGFYVAHIMANPLYHLWEHWDVCGLPDCENTTGLKACPRQAFYSILLLLLLLLSLMITTSSRCQTIRYVSSRIYFMCSV